jgi:putative membrane protein
MKARSVKNTVKPPAVNTALSAFIALCEWPVYRYYLTQPNPFHVSPPSDQVLGAVIGWVVCSFVFLMPAALITFGLMRAPATRMA